MKIWTPIAGVLLLALVVTTGVAKEQPVKAQTHKASAEFNRPVEKATQIQITGEAPLTIPARQTRVEGDITVETVLVDSSMNGYGLVVGDTEPIAYIPGVGISMAYRQWQGIDASSGYIGSAFSTDGTTWQTYANLNSVAPGQRAGRYPSTIGGQDYPWVFWNETGAGTGGGGDYGGRPLYTYDEFGWQAGSFATPADVTETAGDPADLWVGSPSITQDGDGADHINVIFSKWTGARDVYHFYAHHEAANDFGFLDFSTAYPLFDGADFQGGADGTFTSNASVAFNSSGLGYAACTSYFLGDIPDSSHTLMIRKSEDYGATWNESGMNGTGYYYIPSQTLVDLFLGNELLPDTLFDSTTGEIVYADPAIFLGYDNHIRIDEDGTLHVFTNALPSAGDFVYPYVDGVGFYHLWTDTPETPESWQISQVADMGFTYPYSHGEQSNWQRIFTNSAISKDDQSVMYNVYTAFLDTTVDNPIYEVVVLRSEDGGITWSDSVNITNFPGNDFDAIDAHLARVANDSTCYVMYQVPDYNVETVTPSEVPEDFKNRVYFAKVTFSATGTAIDHDVESLPTDITLQQNYPNPFNPTTVIEYSLDTAAPVTLAIYDVTGQQVKVLESSQQNAGLHRITVDGADMAAGMYFYKLTAGNTSKIKKMVLIK